MRRKILSLLIVICLLLGQFATTALAVTPAAGGTETAGAVSQLCSCDTLCTEGAVDTTCPVCAAKEAVLAEVCQGAPAEGKEPTGASTPVLYGAPAARSEGWTYDAAAGTLTRQVDAGRIVLQNVTASGTDLTIGDNRWTTIRGTVLDLTAPITDENGTSYQIVAISSEAFRGNVFIVELYLPDGLQQLGRYAFTECKALEKVSFGSGQADDGTYAFQDCTSLKTADLSQSGITRVAN